MITQTSVLPTMFTIKTMACTAAMAVDSGMTGKCR